MMKRLTIKFFILIFVCYTYPVLAQMDNGCKEKLGIPVMYEDFGKATSTKDLVIPLPPGITSYNYNNGIYNFPIDNAYAVTTSTKWLCAKGDSIENYRGWLTMKDHTSSDTMGRMLVVNADINNAGIFYQKEINGLCPDAKYEFAAWIANVLVDPKVLPGKSCVPHESINVTFEVQDVGNANKILGSITTGKIGDNQGKPDWRRVSFMLPTTGTGKVKVILRNNGLGGCGNDLAIDDITFAPCGSKSVMQLAPPPCGGGPYTVTVSGVTLNNPWYQWQKSTDGGTTWTNIGGPTQTTTINESLFNTTTGPITVTYRVVFATTKDNVAEGSACRYISDLISVTIPPLVKTDIASTNVGCTVAGTASITVTSGSPDYTYQWSNGATTSSITGLSPGIYSVTVKDKYGCNDTKSVTITGAPVLSLTTATTPACGSKSGSATATGIGGTKPYTYVWAPTGQTTSSISGITAGVYTVSIIDATNCTAVATQSVLTSPYPVANFSSLPVCFNTKPTDFKDLSQGNTTVTKWEWDFGDGNKSGVQNPSHTFATAGTFSVTLIVTNATGCKDTIKHKAIINPLPVPNFSAPVVCQGVLTCFTDLSTIPTGSVVGWSWNFGDPNSGLDNTSLSRNPCHKFTGKGPYTVMITATSDSGCQTITNKQVSLYPPPVAAINPQNVCFNSTTHFLDGSTSATGDQINKWKWDFGDGVTSMDQNPFHRYGTFGTYTITLSVISQNGCKDTTKNTVTVYPPPIAKFLGSGLGCKGVCVTNYMDTSLHPMSTIATWQWSFPGGVPSSSTEKNPPKVCYNAQGVYGAKLIVTTNHGCRDTIVKDSLVFVYGMPKAVFSVVPEVQPVSDPTFDFFDEWMSDVKWWSWDFGDGSPIDTVHARPMHSYSTTATKNDFYKFNICLTVKNTLGCIDTICHPIRILPEYEFYIPNTFTPNGDGTNEFFFGKSRGVKEYQIWIFDRWGNEIWSCEYNGKNTDWDDDSPYSKGDGLSAACQWDGRVVGRGMDLSGSSQMLTQQDVYVWKVKLKDIFDRPHFFIGNVNVVH